MLTSHHAFRPAEHSLAWIHGSMNYQHPEVLAWHKVGRTGLVDSKASAEPASIKPYASHPKISSIPASQQLHDAVE
jgi:hypothetical protein